jgi:hypothetical protein
MLISHQSIKNGFWWTSELNLTRFFVSPVSQSKVLIIHPLFRSNYWKPKTWIKLGLVEPFIFKRVRSFATLLSEVSL